MGKIYTINNKDIEEVLKNVSRQYLVGNLKKPQILNHITDKNLEVGITDYDEYSTEVVHYHTIAREYQYVLSGWTKYMDVDTNAEYEFKKGDFYCIEKGTVYAQKSKKGTRILFVKVPSINDKNVIDTPKMVKKWYDDGLKTIRKDYFHEVYMPEPNSLKPAAAVAIIKEKNVLMLKRADNGKWTLPGGTLEMNESLPDCAVREVTEETGLNVKIIDVIGTYTDPNVRIEYSDGEVRREFTIVYYGTTDDRKVVLDEESTNYSWISMDAILNLPMAESQKKRVQDVINYYVKGKKTIE